MMDIGRRLRGDGTKNIQPGVFKAGKSTHGWPAWLSRVWSSISRSSGTGTDAGQVPAVAKPGRSLVRSAMRHEPTNYQCEG